VTRAAVYCRISKDDEGDGRGVERQRQDAAAYRAEHGYETPEVYEDNDYSASSYAVKNRPEFDRMIESARSGELDVIVLYDLDRLTRVPRVGEDIIDLAAKGLTIIDGTGTHDLTTGDGRHRFRGAISNAALESDKLSKRMKRKKAELAERGVPAGGGRAFCYEPDGVTIRESEAVAYRQAARDVLAGKSTTAIAKEWNAHGLRTARRGGLWAQVMVRRVLTSPRHAGLRAHQGEVIGPAAWPAIVDRATHEALVAVLANGAKKNPRRRSLLTGLVRCGVCGTPMSRDGRSWRCRPSYRYPEACGRVQVRAVPLEALVEEIVVELLGSPKLAKAMADLKVRQSDEDTALDVAKAEAKLTELDEMLGDGVLTRASFLRARKAPERKLADARARLARRNGSHALERFRAARPRELYETLDVDERRAVISALLDHVVIHPAKNRAPRLDVDRVAPVWKA
jgi:site-specific DNA recombinase